MKRFISILVLVCLMAAMLTVSAYAEEYYAPTQADFENVLSMASDGDVIRLANGEYKIPSGISVGAVTIQGAGSDRTKISLPAAYSGSASIVDAATESQGGAALPHSTGGAALQAKLIAPQSGSVPTASVGGVDYPSIQAAVDAAESSQTVYVTSGGTMDITAGVTNSDGYYTLINVAGKSITIDLNGCSIYAETSGLPTGTKGDMLLGVISVDAGASLVLKDSGGSGSVSAVANGATLYSMICNYAGGVDIQSGNYYCDGLGNGRGMIYDNGHRNTLISGGNFTLANVGTQQNGSPWIVSASGSNSSAVEVSGGTFNDDIFDMHWRHECQIPDDSDVGNALAAKNNGDGTYTVVPASVAQYELEGGYWYLAGYESFEEAFEAAAGKTIKDDTIHLVADVTVNNDTVVKNKIAAGADVTLTLNANITGENGDYLFGVSGHKLTVTGNGEIKNENGSIFNGTPSTSQLAVAGGTWYGFDPSDYLVPGATVREISDNVWMVNAPPIVPGNKPEAANPYAVPSTGDNSNVPLWGLLFVIFAAVAVVTGKKRKA